MKTEKEIRDQIKALADKMENLPEEIKSEDTIPWLYFCKGGISALYWILNEPNPYVMWGPKK